MLDDAFDPAQKYLGLHMADFSTLDDTHFGACNKSDFITSGHFDFPSVIQGILPNCVAGGKKRDGNAVICVLRSDQAPSTPMRRNKMLAKIEQWEPAAVALEVTASESGDIVAVKDRNIRVTAEEIYEIARRDLPPFMTGSVPSL